MNMSLPLQWSHRAGRGAVRLWERTAFLRYASPRDWIKSVLVIGAFGALGASISEYGIYLDTSEVRCMPQYLYAAEPRSGAALKHGDMVSFVAARDEMLGLMPGKRIGKLVVAMAGDHVRSDETGVHINGKFVAPRSELSLVNMRKKGAEPVSTNRVLLAGEIFVMGTLPRSFDSRYWGPMQDSHIDKFVTPLI